MRKLAGRAATIILSTAFAAAVAGLLVALFDPPWELPASASVLAWLHWGIQRVLDLGVIAAAVAFVSLSPVQWFKEARGRRTDWSRADNYTRGVYWGLWGFAAVAAKLVYSVTAKIVSVSLEMFQIEDRRVPGIILLSFFGLIALAFIAFFVIVLTKSGKARKSAAESGAEIVVGTVVRKTRVASIESAAHRAGELVTYGFVLDSGREFHNVGHHMYMQVEEGQRYRIELAPVLGEILAINPASGR
jgi:hypothetical protein